MLMKPPMPPPARSAKRRMRKNQSPKKITAGRIQDSRSRSQVLSIAREYGTWYWSSHSDVATSTRLATITVLPPSGFFSLPVMVVSPITTSVTRCSASACSNSLKGTGSTVRACHTVCSMNRASRAISQ